MCRACYHQKKLWAPVLGLELEMELVLALEMELMLALEMEQGQQQGQTRA
jgi:hypothetical protein